MNSSSQKYVAKASLIAIIASSVILAIKVAAYLVTDSKIILSDALEGVVHLCGSGLAFFFIRLSGKPPDRAHPYGHGKSEYFSAYFEGGLIILAGVGAVLFSVQSLLDGSAVEALDSGLLLIVVCSLLNILLARYLLGVGKQHSSIALVASGHHLLTDFITSVGSLIALSLVWVTGIVEIDSIVAIVFGLYLFITGVRIVRKALHGLLDARDDERYQAFVNSANEVVEPGIIKIHRLKILHSGRLNIIDAHVVVPEFWRVDQAHQKMEVFEKRLSEHYGQDAELHFHLDPCQRKFCSECDLVDCPVRQSQFIERKKYTSDDIEGIV